MFYYGHDFGFFQDLFWEGWDGGPGSDGGYSDILGFGNIPSVGGGGVSILPTTAGAINALKSEGCAGVVANTNSQAAISLLNSAPIFLADLPIPVGTKQPDGAFRYSYQVAATSGGTIFINSVLASSDLSKFLIAYDSGKPVYANLLADFERHHELIQGSVSTESFWGIFYLHELGHMANPGRFRDDTDNPGASESYTQRVIENCFQDLIPKPY